MTGCHHWSVVRGYKINVWITATFNYFTMPGTDSSQDQETLIFKEMISKRREYRILNLGNFLILVDANLKPSVTFS